MVLRGGSDARLIEETLKGSERAFRRLVERHHSLVYSVVRAVIGDRDDIEDVVQEVLIKVYRGLPRFRAESKFTTWVYRIARNESLSAAERARPDMDPVDETALAAVDGGGADEYRRIEARRDLDRSLEQLDEKLRIAIELRYLAEKSYAEIAEIMDLPMGTVKTYIHRAKLELKQLLSRRSPGGKPMFRMK